MNDKEYVLVSQGIEIYRTRSQENAVNMVKKSNDEYFDYLQKCYDNYERPADNYVDLEIEYASEMEKDKEIERLSNIIDKAIEYIENNSLYEQDYDYDYEENIVELPPDDEISRRILLGILKDSDEIE